MTEYGCSACEATFPAEEYESAWRAMQAAVKHVQRTGTGTEDGDHADAGVVELNRTEATAL
jgi:hypothetical protein